MDQPMRLPPDARLPVLGVRAGDVPERIVVVGDPARAAAATQRLDEVEELGRSREYLTYRGTHQGSQIGVVSHGVGAAGAGVCFEELCRAGAQRIIRAGTCGGMQPHVTDGHHVVATAAVREDGFTKQLVPQGFPAAADPKVSEALIRCSQGRVTDLHIGIVLTSAVFYPHRVLGSNLEFWQRAGVVAVEMEVAALYVVAALHGVEAGAILAVDGNPLAESDSDMAGYDPHRQVVRDAVEAMVEIALEAVIA